MKHFNLSLVLLGFALLLCSFSNGQTKRTIQIEYSGFLDRNEEKYPGATVFIRDDMSQVKISHQGATLWCDQAIHYLDEDYIMAYGNVRIIQGDTINMKSNYAEYSGITQLAFASGDVVLTEPSNVLSTDTLWFDRLKQQAFYKSYGTVAKDTSGTISSRIGRYYMEKKKYQFVEDVNIIGEDYIIDSEQVDYYTESGRAYLFGPSTITGETTKIYCEKGFYDTTNDIGYFLKEARIDYDNRLVEGDSIYFDRNKNYASATNNIKITDTINKAIIKGHYAEVFKDKDSVFITKRALAITVQENDSIYIHGDTLMVTGDEENRITRAFYNVKLYKSDLSGKADSIHVNHQTGLTQMMNLQRFSTSDAFTQKRNPVLWNIGNQMTGDSIHLISNTESKQLDSLKVFDDAFVVSRDTLEAGYNQLKGRTLIGLFNDNAIHKIDIIKNAETIYYMRDDKTELIGIDKAKSGSIQIFIDENVISELRRIKQVDGNLYPEDEMEEKDRILRGFIWREDERPKSVEDLFQDDPPLVLPIIKGLDDYIPQEDFFDEELLNRIETAKGKNAKSGKESNAYKVIPRDVKERPRETKPEKLNKPLKKTEQPKKKN